MPADSLGPLIIDLEGDLALGGGDRERLRHPLVGGVILFGRNCDGPSQLRALVHEIKALRFPSLLITVDQEGGRVQRFQRGFTRLPPAAACGRLYDADPDRGRRLARDIGLVMASELIECGVDLSFAPVLDVLSRDSRVIGDRAFHVDPGAVGELAAAYIDGMQTAGMGSVGKHFPGHGGVSADSHIRLPRDRRTLAQLRECDLLPFTALAPRLAGVMLAHVRYGRIDKRIPSYSSFWIRELLKAQIGFTGVVFSDDLTMAGAGRRPLAERCRMAVEAGCDLLPVCNDLEGMDRLLRAPAAEWPAADATQAGSGLYARPAAPAEADLAAAREAVARAVSHAA